MSFSRRDVDHYLYNVAKEYKKMNRSNPEFEIIIVGGASILLNYNFRDSTTDIDSLIRASSSVKDVINRVGDENGLPNGWINDDFRKTTSFSHKLAEHSSFYKRFCNCLNVRTVNAEYLLAMKMRSHREYKNDLSDIVGIIKEQKEIGRPLSIHSVNKAYLELYNVLPDPELMGKVAEYLESDDLEDILYSTRQREKQTLTKLQEFEEKYPDVLTDGNLKEVIDGFDKPNVNASTVNLFTPEIDDPDESIVDLEDDDSTEGFDC